jgi:hypothetical protein
VTAKGQRTLISHLVDAESLAIIARDGIPLEIIPTHALRPVVTYALDYYFNCGCERAPSAEVLREYFGDAIEDEDVDLDHEPDDSVQWAVEDLKATYVYAEAQAFNKKFAEDLSKAPIHERTRVVDHYSGQLIDLSLSMESRAYRAELSNDAGDILRRYEGRAAQVGEFQGMGLGLAEVNSHTYGVHPGELAVCGAGPKVGKSFYQCMVALREFQRGRRVCLFTLENSVEMMLDRIACMAMGVDSTGWQRGQASAEEVERVARWVKELDQGEAKLWVIQPNLGQRGFGHMVREAAVREAQSLLIDQLTFVELGRSEHDSRPRHEKIGDGMHTLKGLISTGSNAMSCLLTHQINREGVKAAEKVGRIELHHMEGGAEVERTADFIFGLYRGQDATAVSSMLFQMVGARRTDLKNWRLNWRPWMGHMLVSHEEELAA